MSEYKKIFELMDTISSEYGWSFKEIVSLPLDTLVNFYQAILERKKTEYKILSKVIAVATNCGFSGKMEGVNKLFSDSPSESTPEEQIDQLRGLCSTFGMSPEEFEKQLKEGKVSV